MIKGRPWVRTQVEEGFRNTDLYALGYTQEALDLLIPFLDPKEARQSLRNVIQIWKEGAQGPEGEKELLEAIFKIAQGLRVSERMEQLQELVQAQGLKNLSWVLVNLLVPPSSLEAFLHFSEKSGDGDLLRLASYLAALMPQDAYLWNLYLQSRDPLALLRALPPQVSPYRHGKSLKQFDEKELHLAFRGPRFAPGALL